jgi:hypothetical protein
VTSWLDKPLRLAINPGLINKNEARDSRLFVEGWENDTRTPEEFAAAINAGMAYCCELKGARKGGTSRLRTSFPSTLTGGGGSRRYSRIHWFVTT